MNKLDLLIGFELCCFWLLIVIVMIFIFNIRDLLLLWINSFGLTSLLGYFLYSLQKQKEDTK